MCNTCHKSAPRPADSVVSLIVTFGVAGKGRIVNIYKALLVQRRGGLMVRALDSGSKGPGSSPGRVIVLCSWARHFTLTVPLSTQEYKWVPTPSRFMLRKPG